MSNKEIVFGVREWAKVILSISPPTPIEMLALREGQAAWHRGLPSSLKSSEPTKGDTKTEQSQ